MTSPEIERLLTAHTLVALEASDDEVAVIWRKALRAYQDSHLPGLSSPGAFNAAYEAALAAAATLVRDAGYTVKSPGGHHWATFYAIQGLESEELARFGTELDGLRRKRHDNVYGTVEDTALAERWRNQMHAVLDKFLPAAHARLIARRPRLRNVLQDPREIHPKSQ
ncbi:MAG TPA: hypothetical protein VF746_06250 [Longimicrobium sp.]|jgi:hypothetical protein